MAILHALKSLCCGVGRWIQETYCTVGQRVAERLEDVSDAMAEQRYRAEHPQSPEPPIQQAIDVTDYRVINGYKHTN
jgi:hypothetical protein